MDVTVVVPGKLFQTYAVMCKGCGEWALGLDNRKDIALIELKESKWHKFEGEWHCQRCAQQIAPELFDCGCDKKNGVVISETDETMGNALLPDGTVDYDRLHEMGIPINTEQ